MSRILLDFPFSLFLCFLSADRQIPNSVSSRHIATTMLDRQISTSVSGRQISTSGSDGQITTSGTDGQIATSVTDRRLPKCQTDRLPPQGQTDRLLTRSLKDTLIPPFQADMMHVVELHLLPSRKLIDDWIIPFWLATSPHKTRHGQRCICLHVRYYRLFVCKAHSLVLHHYTQQYASQPDIQWS